jgi:hypothetical protein
VQTATPHRQLQEGSTPPPGCSRYSISIKKPLGLVLEQNATGVITVAEISPEGSAAKTGLVAVVSEASSQSAHNAARGRLL